MRDKIKFIDLKLFSDEYVEENKKILKEIFLIDFSKPETLIRFDNIDLDEDMLEDNLGIIYKEIEKSKEVNNIRGVRNILNVEGKIYEAQYPIEFYTEVIEEISSEIFSESLGIEEFYKKILSNVEEKHKNDQMNKYFRDCFDKEILKKYDKEFLHMFYKKLIQKHNNKIFEEVVKAKRKSFKEILEKISLEQEGNIILKNLIDLSCRILQNHNVSYLDFYPINKEELQFTNPTINLTALNIIFNNIQNSIFLYKEFKEADNKNIIDFKEAFKKYVHFKNNYYAYNFESITSLKDEEKRKKEEKNIRNKLENKFRCNKFGALKNSVKNFENLFYCKEKNTFKIFNDTSNIFLYTIDNYNSCKNYTKIVEEKNTFLNNSIKTNKKFVEEFLLCGDNFNFTDVYLFERIYNNNFTLSLYKNLKRNKEQYDNNLMGLLSILSSIVYMPNNYYWDKILNDFLALYLDKYQNDVNGFEKEVREKVLGFSFYIIPLHNMVFSIVLKLFCDLKNISIDQFIKGYVEKNKKIMLEKHIEILNNFIKDDSIKDNRKFDIYEFEYKIVDCTVNGKLNFEEFNMSDIIKFSGRFNMQSRKNREEYLEIFKEFVLNLLYIEKNFKL